MSEIAYIEYNYIGEIAGLILAGLILCAMVYTKPKNTYVYKYIFGGMILSVIAILIHISILVVANNPDEYFNNEVFLGQLLCFLLVYNGVLYCIFSYVNMMSIVRRSQRKEFFVMYSILSVVYVLGVIIEIASRNFYKRDLTGIDITHFTRYYCGAGIVCAIICFNATLTNLKDVSRVIWDAVSIVVPVDAMILVAQMFCVGRFNSIFSSMTYVPVFALGYMLFHSNPYDEITGCQNAFGLDAYLTKHLGKKKLYICYITLMLPRIEKLWMEDNDLTLKGVAICRAMESISLKLKMYRVSENRYVNVLETDNENEFFRCVNSIRGVLDGAKSDLTSPFNYRIVAGEVYEEINNLLKCRQYFEYVARRFRDQNSSYFYITIPRDYDDFLEEFEISGALEDIRNKLDFEDERILVYAQPIYNVETGSFRVAEALTRLKIGNKIINPDKFIPIAEDTGTIHAITCIVLDKVCKAIDSFVEFYDFDAISINISSKEISHHNINSEIFDILDKYDFDLSKLRFEITESAMFDSYNQANENMTSLTRAGIQFYLDDFGTGYSSLERVMDCPVRTIKFDKTLLYKSLDDDRMDDILRYMIEVFKKNGFNTVIEGVEDESQNQYSVERGFDYIQGYHYAKPEPIEEVKKYFTRITKF
ncbi:EAL domain-containing protein [Butyrivibrio sp. YAB3001]|uniref:EAL domain-containing protein n=1 Tax=Butyrivibrio sp. YAB3001 TaxID=1520812 RepID=UPI0008F64BF5|nr:EAL domain-containing protein [Butyrivibrio sp. YAB3001]SFB72731.1 EAL domain, c-di-GMP-specific phosphodiesterase class I (or its enzymatically inactive variant) [Butyrivibrio sp. YAB3001]